MMYKRGFLAYGLMLAMSAGQEYEPTNSYEPRKDPDPNQLKRNKENAKKKRRERLNRFEFDDGTVVYALNKKNANRKYKNLKKSWEQ